MKNTFLKYIKISLMLVLLLQAVRVQAQGFVNWTLPASANTSPITGTFSGGTVTVSQGTTGTDLKFYTAANVNYNNLNSPISGQAFTTVGPNGTPPSKSLIFTFSQPVIINELSIGDINTVSASWNDGLSFSGVSFTSVTGANCSYTTTGATPTTNIGNSAEYARWTTSTTAVTSFTINYANVGGVTHAALHYAMKVTATCNAGSTAPTLSATTKATTCPSTTVDLTALLTSTTPVGASLVWYTNNAHTGTAIADATQVATAGTYYAFYYDATNSCYSPASAAIAVTITNCCTFLGAPIILN